MIWYDMIWYDMIWYMIYDIWYMIYDMIYDMIDIIWNKSIQYDMMEYYMKSQHISHEWQEGIWHDVISDMVAI